VELKQPLHKPYLDIVNTNGGAEKVRDRIAEVFPHVWATIPDILFEKLWKSMSSRVGAMIEAKGWYTKY